MKRLIFSKIWMITVLGIVPFQTVFSQQTIKFIADSSSFQIKGTSNLHEWEEKVQKFNVDMVLNFNNHEIKGIDKVLFSCNSASVLSESSIMTSKTHDALKVEKFPEIKFTLSDVVYFQDNDGKISGSINGNLVLAGVTNKVNLTFSGSVKSKTLTIKGSKQLKMTDFKIDPPTAMLGTLKTADNIELSYSLQFKID
jgi:polyisoprenoid-binding protein YceI